MWGGEDASVIKFVSINDPAYLSRRMWAYVEKVEFHLKEKPVWINSSMSLFDLFITFFHFIHAVLFIDEGIV